MNTSVLEITDQQYLIKLDKQEFDLSFINTLLKRIQSEKTFFKRFLEDEEDIISKSRSFEERDVDHLSEK